MAEMTTFQLWMVGLGIVGCLMSAGGIIGASVIAVRRIKEDITEKISEERTRVDRIVEADRENFQRTMGRQADEFHQSLKDLADRFMQEQKTQDDTHGQMGISLRASVMELNEKVYKFELFVRDNYALKEDVKESIGEVRKAVAALASDIKTDFKELNAKIDKRAA